MTKHRVTSDANASSRNPFLHALEYAGMGWRVFPSHSIIRGICTCKKGDKCKSPSKHPQITGWPTEATADQKTIKDWTRRFKFSNISVATGAESGLVVIDVDPRSGGRESLTELERILGPLPKTITANTGGGGQHLYFKYPNMKMVSRTHIGTKELKRALTGVDVRADGGQAIAAPSLHQSGNAYQWKYAPESMSVADLPKAWCDFLSSPNMQEEDRPKRASHETTSSGDTAAMPVIKPRLKPILKGCAWMRHCREDAMDIPEPAWYAALTIIGRTNNGRKHAHEISAPHKEYTRKATDQKLAQALTHGPRGCKHIQSDCGGDAYCKDCQNFGHIRSPIDLGHYDAMPEGFYIRGNRLYQSKESRDGEVEVPVSDLIIVKANTRDRESRSWGKLLSWADPDGKRHEYILPAEAAADTPATAVRPLLHEGLRVYNKVALMDFIQSVNSKLRLRIAHKTGWIEDSYILANGEVISSASIQEKIRLHTGSCAKTPQIKGTTKSWREEVAALCAGNSRLIFSVSVALASYLLHHVGEESGGFHLRGGSSKGKSKCQAVAASVGGMGMETWRATGNGLEGIAAQYNDAFLWLDELAQVDAREIGEVAYMLAGGQGKARLNKDTTLRDSKTWRLLFISSGEVSLADHMASVGKMSRAGMDARMPDIPALVEGGHGVFEELHGSKDGDTFARKLESVSREHCGTAGPAFLRNLIDDIESAKAFIAKRRAYFTGHHVPPGSDGQVSRVAGRFSLVAAAGELAIKFGVVPWEKGSARKAVAKCFRDWLNSRGHTNADEGNKMEAQVRKFLEQHGDSRFTSLSKGATLDTPYTSGSRTTYNRAGYVRKGKDTGDKEYVFLSEVWKSEVCKGFNPRDVVRELIHRGHMKADTKGHAPTPERIPGTDRPVRAYVIRSSILSGEGDVAPPITM